MLGRIGRRAVHELKQLIGGGVAAVAGVALFCLTVVSLVLTVVGGAGVPALVGITSLSHRLCDAHRRWSGDLTGRTVPSPYQPLPESLLPRWRAIVGEKATWRDLAWLVANFPVSFGSMAIGLGLWASGVQALFAPLVRAVLPADVDFDPLILPITNQGRAWLMVVLGPFVLAAAFIAPHWLLQGRAYLARWLLGPTATDQLSHRVGELAATRAAAVDSAATELRRIERDLHDGPQARLASLAIHLGVAEDVVEDDPAAAKTMLVEARASARAALDELRGLVRGIHPPVLADRGLAGAINALALTSPIPVQVHIGLDRRLPAPVESAAYFVIAEALANAIRHSQAQRIDVAVEDRGTNLRLIVADDGRGGADPSKGTGLRGMARRIATFDGRLTILSPAGGPTILDMELPCGS
jgi:signal transduction histidine kinase